ncbi:helix-turn-helix domain-containing protein [Frankia sp. Cas3]|uniref:helix-turn-helix domain-containing protein n=1 Tax=Frankia sp. Cas3 TaxID=3073926 RepID=UPI002AD38535|nr:helix-turn-helix domain-containing protein [Frankia sp. Cas3]
MVDDIPTLLTNVGSGTQLAIPGALVLLPASDSGTPVADRTAWQRAVLRSCLPRAAKLVALALASHAVDVATICEPGQPALPGPAAVCSPGLVTLAAETGYSRTHVQRQIRLLRDLGWLIGLTRPAARRPASFVLSMSDSVRATASVAPAPVMPAPAASAVGGSARRAPVPIGDGVPDSAGPLPRQAGARPSSDRPSAAARRRSRVTGTAVAKALTGIGNLSAVTPGPAPAQESSGSPSAVVAPVGLAPTVVAPTVVAPTVVAPTAGGGEPDLPVVAERLVADAAGQVVATLACAMRRDPESLTVASDRLARILTIGLWSAAELAMHLVDTIGPSLGAGRVDDPVDHLLRRLDHLPASASECLCRSCRSWVTAPAGVAQGAPSAVGAERAAPASLPGLAAIEQAAAAGAAQSRVHHERTSGAA